MKFTLDPDRFIKKALLSLSNKQNKATTGLIEVAKTLTPEDTGLMVDSYKLKKASIDGHVVSTWVINTATDDGFPYPYVVDKWVDWKIFRYQKPRWRRWRHIWVGVHTFSRSIDAFKTKFLNILKE